MSFQQTLHGHITQADKATDDYYYVPFTLPRAAKRLSVRYAYSAAISSNEIDGGNVIDLGLFDPRGLDFPGTDGFRGWSGSARQEFTITLADATPGYLPGPLPAGEYHLILGLYRIGEAGADYEIIVEAELDENGLIVSSDKQTAPESQHRAMGPPRLLGEPRYWLCGDLQSHTYHSDANGSLEQLVAKARALKLDFLAVTDHNTISHHRHLATVAGADLLLLYGQEVTTYYGHMNVWGTRQWCDFRARTVAQLRAILDMAHPHGRLCSINHPKVGGPAWEYGFDLPVDTMEVWQGPWPHRNDESLALWDQLLCAGKMLRAVGGSDYHCPAGAETNLLRLGQPTTWVLAKERSRRGILEAIYAGRTTIGAHPTGPRLTLSAMGSKGMATMGEIMPVAHVQNEQVEIVATVWHGAGYDLRIVVDGHIVHQNAIKEAEQKVTLSAAATTYLRAELVGDLPDALIPPTAPANLARADWRWALSNPIFIE